nr:oligopeptide/dipeptide ABC transporter ATP-binding protein [Marinicella sp. W31]MDC2876276.1 hypothetical protein [Marinicella sp. W31]
MPRPAPSVNRERQMKGELPSPLKPPEGCHFRPRCPYATDKCLEKPPLRQIGAERLVACHYGEQVAGAQ